MDKSSPVFTLINECHDCYKCIRSCKVKAIKLEQGHASVIAEKCIACGSCVKACPSNAKRVRNDVDKVKNLFDQGKKVYVSLAPSWIGSFKHSAKDLIAKLKQLGFYAVSETALGAEEVSIQTSKIIRKSSSKLFISSACPVIVDYIRYYRSEFTSYITPIASPALTHAKMLRNLYGQDISVVFIGPCVGKKNEADRSSFIDVALTFAELKSWLNEQEDFITHEDITNHNAYEDCHFIPHQAHEGALYPLSGGMNEGIKLINNAIDNQQNSAQMIGICSLDLFASSLDGLNPENLTDKIFIEALACDNGCINGPCIASNESLINKTSSILSNIHNRKNIPQYPTTVLNTNYEPKITAEPQYSLDEIANSLKKIGKYSLEDELNCGGCGYSTCRELAVALLKGNAEPSMCVSYMRKLAVKKTNALLKCMPSGMVMVNKELKIIESNDVFMKMFLGNAYELFAKRSEGLTGAFLDKIIDFADMFKDALKFNKEIHKECYSYKGLLYDIAIFPLEEHELVGAIITDVTKGEMNREKIARKAQQVISSNIAIVQEIACLLGEHVVETETLLSSIADTYGEKGEL